MPQRHMIYVPQVPLWVAGLVEVAEAKRSTLEREFVYLNNAIMGNIRLGKLHFRFRFGYKIVPWWSFGATCFGGPLAACLACLPGENNAETKINLYEMQNFNFIIMYTVNVFLFYLVEARRLVLRELWQPGVPLSRPPSRSCPLVAWLYY